MGLINFILDVAGLLLWLNWRWLRADPMSRATPATLAGTLRRTEPSKLRRWHVFLALAALLIVRAYFYWQIGPAVNWTPRLDLVFVVLPFPFRSTTFIPQLLFSTLSLLQTFIVFYFWLIVLSLLNRRGTDPDPVQKIITLQTGRISRWPVVVQLFLPSLIASALWFPLVPLLAGSGVIDRTQSTLHLIQQSALVGLAVFFSLKLLLPGVLVLHIIVSYVYLGSSPVWDFVSAVSRTLLSPLNRLPLRLRKVDFAPVVGIAAIVLLLHTLPAWFHRTWTLWPRDLSPAIRTGLEDRKSVRRVFWKFHGNNGSDAELALNRQGPAM